MLLYCFCKVVLSTTDRVTHISTNAYLLDFSIFMVSEQPVNWILIWLLKHHQPSGQIEAQFRITQDSQGIFLQDICHTQVLSLYKSGAYLSQRIFDLLHSAQACLAFINCLRAGRPLEACSALDLCFSGGISRVRLPDPKWRCQLRLHWYAESGRGMAAASQLWGSKRLKEVRL